MNSEILLAQPRGFCAGVNRAIEIVERALMKFGAPIYVLNEIVHNAYVVNELRNQGAIFIKEIQDIPVGNTIVFCAWSIQGGTSRGGFTWIKSSRCNLSPGK
jgi:4-hydroxy-3-methylbut-2-enyl diphosphate reductase